MGHERTVTTAHLAVARPPSSSPPLTAVGLVAAVVTVAVPASASFTATITAICAIGVWALDYMRDTSRLNAVRI